MSISSDIATATHTFDADLQALAACGWEAEVIHSGGGFLALSVSDLVLNVEGTHYAVTVLLTCDADGGLDVHNRPADIVWRCGVYDVLDASEVIAWDVARDAAVALARGVDAACATLKFGDA